MNSRNNQSFESYSVDELVDLLDLKPHPEGGFYKETYRAEQRIFPDGFSGERNTSTGIYFLLRACDFSAFHKIQSDEMWHFYAGSPLEVIIMDSTGCRSLYLGNDLKKGQVFQGVVPAGSYFASRLIDFNENDQETYSLVGCTVSPGFDFADFEMPDRSTLTSLFPEHRAVIKELTRIV